MKNKNLYRNVKDLVTDSAFGSVYEGLFGLSLDSQPEEAKEEKRNYPQFEKTQVGVVFNRRSVLLRIRWGNVQGKPTLRSTITRVKSRDEEDQVLLQFDMTAEPGEDGHFKHPKQYVFHALKEVKKQFREKVGCVVCGKPDIWFKKVQTPQFPLYQVMWKELDFADADNRVCRECDKLVNRRQAEFNPVPELDDDGNQFDSIFADSVSEPYTVRRDLQLDSRDFLAALDTHASNLQLGG